MPISPPMRVCEKRGKTIARKSRAASGLDFPTRLVGVSTWLGSDGKPVTVYYDPSTGNAGLAAAQYLLTKIDDIMRSCEAWFGVRGLGGSCIVAPDFGGAYHYGCDFTNGGDWYLSIGAQDTVVGLAVAEITESYMGLQAKGWDCGGSGGEALSRVLAEIATGGPNGAMSDYSSGPSWDGNNWIDRDQGSDRDYPSIGCGVLYLWWLLQKGITVEQLVQAGESAGTLASNYATVLGGEGGSAWAAFRSAAKAVGAPGSIQSDNPFGSIVVPYPASHTPPPPPPPPPPPGGGGTVTLTGTVGSSAAGLPVSLSGEWKAATVGVPHSISTWAVLLDLAQIAADARAHNWVAVAADVQKLLTDLGVTIPAEGRAALVEGLQAHAEDGEEKTTA